MTSPNLDQKAPNIVLHKINTTFGSNYADEPMSCTLDLIFNRPKEVNYKKLRDLYHSDWYMPFVMRRFPFLLCDDNNNSTHSIQSSSSETTKAGNNPQCNYNYNYSSKHENILFRCQEVHTICYAYDTSMVLAVIVVTVGGIMVMYMPTQVKDEMIHVNRYADVVLGMHHMMICAMSCMWTFNDILIRSKRQSQLLASSWLCGYLHHRLRLVRYEQVFCDDKPEFCIGMKSRLLHLSNEAGRPNLKKSDSQNINNTCIYKIMIVNNTDHYSHLPRVVINGRPAKKREVCVLTDLTQHAKDCGCIKCAPDADFPYRVNRCSGKIEPLPINCHVCINGTVAFDTPMGVFAIGNYHANLDNIKINNMPKRKKVPQQDDMNISVLEENGYFIEHHPRYLKWLENQQLQQQLQPQPQPQPSPVSKEADRPKVKRSRAA